MGMISQSRQLHLDLLFDSLNRQPVSLLRAGRSTRVQIIHDFFPDLPVQALPEGRRGGRAEALLADIAPGSRTFCHVCQRVDEDFKNYLNYFFTAQREKSAFCRNLFVSLFEGGRDPLPFMTEKCAAVLRSAGVPETPDSDARSGALAAVLEEAVNALAARLPELSLPQEILRRDLRASLPAGLARTIASCAVYLDVSAFKNDRKRGEMLAQLHKLLYAIWQIRPQDVAWQAAIAQGVRAFREGDHPGAQERFGEAQRLLAEEDRRSNEATASYADLLSYQAHMLLDGSGGERSCPRAYELIQRACRVNALDGSPVRAPRRYYECAYFQLFHPEEWTQHSGEAPDTFLPLLERAAQEGCMDAQLLLADLYLSGSHGCARDEARGVALLEEGAARTDAAAPERARCELRLAQHYLEQPASRQADAYYEKAARLGSYAALVHLRQKHFRPAFAPEVTVPLQADGRICLVNSRQEGDAGSVLCASLTPEWEQRCGAIAPMLREEPQILQYGQMVFAFLSDDERGNLHDALETLKLLGSAAGQQQEAAQLALMDRTDLFVLVCSETGRLMIDAAMNQLPRGVYFRVHVCDPDLMAANELLQRCPTFLPCIGSDGSVKEEHWKHQKKSERCRRRIVLLGAGRCAMMILRQIIACTYLEEYPTELAVAGPDAQRMEIQLREECPGLFAGGLAQHITPQFYPCALEELPIHRTGEGALGQLHSLLHSADYFVAAGGDDMDNVALALRLRTGLIRASLPHGTQPVIAVLYRDGSTRWIASQIAVGAQDDGARYHWTENYGLHLFGSSDMFRFGALMHSTLEKRAEAIHLSYCGTDPDEAQRRCAMGDYWRRSYNRDSSMCHALGMIYRCFGMGIYHADGEDYAARAGDAALARRCEDAWTDELAERAAVIEHERWNGWCLSRGWTKPDDDVLVAYLQMQSPKHHLEIGKLHPYITGYQQMIHECERLNELLEAYQHTQRRLPDPRASDRELTRRMPEFLRILTEE